MLLVNLKQKNLQIIKMKLDAETQSGNGHSPSDNEKDNDEVHEDSQPNN